MEKTVVVAVKNNLPSAMCEALVDGWASDWHMTRVIQHAKILADQDLSDEKAVYAEAAKLLKTDSYFVVSCKVWMAKNMRRLNDALWDGRPRDVCINYARRELGLNRKNAGFIFLKARSLDKSHDWNTVK